MKRALTPLAVLLLAGTAALQAALATEQTSLTIKAKASSTQNAPAFKNENERTSYAIGVQLGNRLRSQQTSLNMTLCIQGLQDALAGGKMLLSEQEVATLIDALREGLKDKQAAAHAEQMRDLLALAARNKQQGEAFLRANKINEGVVTLESGLQYKVLKPGNGKTPSAGDTVVCHYWAMLIDGTEFDTSYKRSKPASVPLPQVIKGWQEALQLMPVGSKWQLFIPPSLAYGERGAGRSVGPNATVIYEVELISIEEKS